ncbi:MAG: nucleotide sugar dehydrogenase [Ferruginibacter sp.]
MKSIAIFGLGYVGVVTAACFAKEGYRVYGVDVSDIKVQMINDGLSPIVEDQIGELVKDVVANGYLTAHTDVDHVISKCDIVFVCVGTPSAKNGSLNTDYIERVCTDIGLAAAKQDKKVLLVVRSTLLPGSIEKVVIPSIEKGTGKPVNDVAEVLFHPEFLREGSSVYDFYNPPKIVVGKSGNGDGAKRLVELYRNIDAPTFIVDYQVAEMVKYCDNIFHAVKVTFANEIGQYCTEADIDSHEVMKIFVSDVKLNISDKYLKPGFAFGGSCLPKDLRAFNYISQSLDTELPMLKSILNSNQLHITRVVEHILSYGISKVGIYGLSFKKGTDDLRESPIVTLVESLLGKGVQVTVYDKFVNVAKLVGGNKAYINEKLPHISNLLVNDIKELDTELIILGHKPEHNLLESWIAAGKQVIDLNHPGGKLFRKKRVMV